LAGRWFPLAVAMAVPMGILVGEVGGPPLAHGDRVVFLGDSISPPAESTEQPPEK